MSDAVEATPRPENETPAAGVPHAYFLEGAKTRPGGGTLHHLPGQRTKPEQLQSSACFDAWAKDDDPA